MELGVGAVSGGILSLAALCESHGEAIEADLAFRGVDLDDIYRGRLTYRRLGVLLRHLPPESAFKTALRNEATVDEDAEPDPEAAIRAQWSRVELLLAGISDGIAVLAYQQSQIHGSSKSSPPAQIPRPGVRIAKAGVRQLPTEARAYLQRKLDERRQS